MSTTIDGSASVTINSGAVLGITSGTAVASTSGTAIDFTGIPSWVKRITVTFTGVSSSGTSGFNIQIGSGAVETSGYNGSYVNLSTATMGSTVYAGTGFQINASTAAYTWQGTVVLILAGSNVWVANGALGGNTAYGLLTMGAKTASGTIDRVRITTVNGTDTFDAGSINILYE